jgi:hypothetical protein
MILAELKFPGTLPDILLDERTPHGFYDGFSQQAVSVSTPPL